MATTKATTPKLKSEDLFLEEDITKVDRGYSYANGFKFGFGFFTAWLLGFLLLGLIACAAGLLLKFH